MLPITQLAHQLATTGLVPQILAAEAWMDAHGGRDNLDDLPIEHHFLNGIYVRSMFVPKGQIFTGMIHKFAVMCIIAKGKLRVMDQNGLVEVTAGMVYNSEPGIKRLGLALEDSVFINVFRTDLTDVETILDDLCAEDYEQYARYLLES